VQVVGGAETLVRVKIVSKGGGGIRLRKKAGRSESLRSSRHVKIVLAERALRDFRGRNPKAIRGVGVFAELQSGGY